MAPLYTTFPSRREPNSPSSSAREAMQPIAEQGLHTPLLKNDFEEDVLEVHSADTDDADEIDDPVIREKLERRLLRKVDRRMSILLLIYILNYVRHAILLSFRKGGWMCGIRARSACTISKGGRAPLGRKKLLRCLGGSASRGQCRSCKEKVLAVPRGVLVVSRTLSRIPS